MQVKEELREKYDHYVKINSRERYSQSILDAAEAVGLALDEGQPPEAAILNLNDRGLTGFMAAAAVSTLCRFHPRGEELRLWWNKRHGSPEALGVVNPSVINMENR